MSNRNTSPASRLRLAAAAAAALVAMTGWVLLVPPAGGSTGDGRTVLGLALAAFGLWQINAAAQR